MTLTKGQVIRAHITDMTHDGYGSVTIDGITIKAHKAVIGDDVTLSIHKIRHGEALATIDTIHTPSPDRVTPPCAHFAICSGCTWQHIHTQLQHTIKKDHLRSLFVSHNLPFDTIPYEHAFLAQYHYRRRARLSVRYDAKKDRMYVGFREIHPRFIANIEQCPILVEESWPKLWCAILYKLECRALIPQLEILHGDTETAFILRILTTPSTHDIQLLKEYAVLHNIRLFLQTTSKLTVHDITAYTDTHTQPTIAYTSGGVTIHAGPFDFVQINKKVADWMLDTAYAWLQPQTTDTLLDLFCGLGPFSLYFAPHVARVHGIELEESMVHKAREHAQNLSYDHITFATLDLFHPPQDTTHAHYDIMIVDPPRSGMNFLAEWVDKYSPKSILYVSCNATTMVRDIAPLLHHKKYTLRHIALMDMFAQTIHYEVMVMLEKIPHAIV